MAEAEKVEEVRVVEEHYVLKLSPAETRTLIAVLARVGGSMDPGVSPRAHTDSVSRALREAANYHVGGGSRIYPEYGLLDGHVMFEDYAKDGER